MSDEIRNALLEEFPELPDRDVVLMQLKGDLIDTLSGLAPVDAETVTTAVAEPEPAVEDVAGEPVAADEVAFESTAEPAAEAAAEPAAEPDLSDVALAESEPEALAQAAEPEPEPELQPSSEAAELLGMSAEPAAEAAAADEPSTDKRGQTMQFFVDDLNLQAAAAEDEPSKDKRGQTMQFFIDDLDLSKRDDA